MTTDRWGVEVSGDETSVAAWNAAWDQFVHFRGDPISTVGPASEHDETFAMGPVLIALYSVLGGSPLDSPVVTTNVVRASRRAETEQERTHVAAITALAAGELTEAANGWAVLGAYAEDFAALRFSHDVYLHVGDAESRIGWSEETLEHRRNPIGRSYVHGMHAFALNEVGRYEEAESFGQASLAAEPMDLWARHALAHVYEDTNDTGSALALLGDSASIWADQDLLATHMWWHLALRVLALGDSAIALEIHDDQLDEATSAFRLCDLSSLLWRLELAGHDVGDRWEGLADRWDEIAERHSCGFLDLHATLAFLRCPEHRGGHRWWSGLDQRPDGDTELDEIFDEVAKPLVAAFRARSAGDTDTFLRTIDRLGDATRRIGGSEAQRQLITLTREATRP